MVPTMKVRLVALGGLLAALASLVGGIPWGH